MQITWHRFTGLVLCSTSTNAIELLLFSMCAWNRLNVKNGSWMKLITKIWLSIDGCMWSHYWNIRIDKIFNAIELYSLLMKLCAWMQFVTNVIGHVDKTWGWMKIKLLSEIDNTNAIDCIGGGAMNRHWWIFNYMDGIWTSKIKLNTRTKLPQVDKFDDIN
jgi:hypothetical protein